MELALTPWRPREALSPHTQESFDTEALLAKMALLAPESGGAGSGLRAAPDVFRTAATLLLLGSYVADAVRRRDAVFGMQMLRLGQHAGLDASDVEALPDVEDRVWLSATADALFWSVGWLERLPDGDPDGSEYGTLVQLISGGALTPVMARAGLRPRHELEGELDRWRQVLLRSGAGAMPRRFAAERCRALRWVLEPRWPSPTQTPWDGSDALSPLPPAPLSAGGPRLR